MYMNTDPLSVIKTLIADQGESVLADARRVRGYLSDFAADISRARKNALVKCLEYGLYAELKNAPVESRAAVKNRLAQKLRDEEGLDLALCAGAMDLLEAAAFEAPPVQPQVPAAEDDWVTVTEQREAEKRTAEQPVPVLPPVPSPAENTAETGGEADVLKKSLQKTKNGLIAAIVTGVIALAVSIGVGIYRYNEIERTWISVVQEAAREYDSLDAQHTDLQSSHKQLAEKYPIIIKDIKAGNWNNNQWINRPGERLNASRVYRLKFSITYEGFVDKTIPLDIKWYYPNESSPRRWEESAPAGYTFSNGCSISKTATSFEINPWGWDVPGNFPRGIHKIEVWYEGVCLGSTTVTLN
jgi:hypothetical protein